MDVENLQKQLEHWKAEAERLQSLFEFFSYFFVLIYYIII